MARKFLLFVAGAIVLILAAGITWSLFGPQLTRFALVPSAPFVAQPAARAGAYSDRTMWIARPDLPGNPALWLPPQFRNTAPRGNAAIFFVHPTSYIDRSGWNAPLDDATANARANLFVRGQASAFNGAGAIWAPRYRQATFGAFLTDRREAGQALDAAYSDVAAAWDAFLREAPAKAPIILAGHSQGSVHLLRLLREKIAGKPVASRIVAAYIVGWPISVTTDLPVLGLPACTQPAQSGCILSWQSFAEPADPSQVVAAFDKTTGFDGRSRRGTPLLCTNPLTGMRDGSAPATRNMGTIIPEDDLQSGKLATGRVPARCDGAYGGRGFLLIGPPPQGIGRYVLPGNNYHVFDYSLFWANVRADAALRLATFERKAAAGPGTGKRWQ